METIYASIATMDDTETERSILNLFEKAKHPERICVGLSCSTNSKSFYKKLVKSFKDKNVKILYTKLTPKSFDSYGTGQARHKAFSMYSGQDYVLQCDSHTNFEQDWDEILVNAFKEAKTELNYDKIVLTAYLGMYQHTSAGIDIIDSRSRYPYYVSGFFNNHFAKWIDKALFGEKNYPKKFYPCVKFNGNFAFGDKEFAKNPGIYKDAFFYDEEIIQAVNLINNEFYMVYPNMNLPLTHLYSDHKNEFGGERKYFIEYLSEKGSELVHDIAHKKYNFLINDKEYVRKYENYAKINLRLGLYKDTYYIPEKYFVGDSFE